MTDIEEDGTVVSRRMVVQEVRTGFHGTQGFNTVVDAGEALEEELEAEPGGYDHLWFEVECPTCGASPKTHCSGDAAERPEWMLRDDIYWDKPCAKRVIAGILALMEEDDD